MTRYEKIIHQLITQHDIMNTPALPSLPYPIKYLTYTEMQQRRDRDLCLICDEKDTSAHRCQTQRIIFILPDDDSYLMSQPPPSIEKMSSAALVTGKNLENKEVTQLNHCSQLNGPMMGSGVLKSSFFMLNKADVAQTGAEDVFQLDGVKPTVHLAHFVVGMIENYCPGVYDHKLFGRMLERNGRKIYERKVFIFDPGGGILYAERGLYKGGDIVSHRLRVKVSMSSSYSNDERTIFIFDPGRKFDFECFFVARLYDAQLNNNPNSSTPMKLTPTSDLEDKVDFEAVVMIRQYISTSCTCPRWKYSIQKKHPETKEIAGLNARENQFKYWQKSAAHGNRALESFYP